MNAVTFHVPGKPQGKARAKTVRNKHTGNTMSYTPETDLLYENYIKDRFLNKCNGMFLERGKPVTLRIVARFLPPKSTSKKRTALTKLKQIFVNGYDLLNWWKTRISPGR